MFCPICGNKVIAEGMRFCMYCGTDLSRFMAAFEQLSSTPAPQPPAQTAPPAAPQPPAQMVTAAAPQPTTQKAAAPADDKRFAVELTEVCDQKLPVIREVRALTGCGLKEAKDLVDCAPSIILRGIGTTEAEDARSRLEQAGARVTLLPLSPTGVIVTTDGERFDVELTMMGINKIAVIKVVRSFTGLGLIEAKELVESAPTLIMRNVSATRAEQARDQLEEAGASVTLFSLSPTGDIVSTDDDRFDVVLTVIGKNKIAVIKEVRSLTGLGLKDAKELVESAPTVILENVSTTRAEQARDQLEEAGALITLVRCPALDAPAEATPTVDDRYDVELTVLGDHKLAVIKVVRSLTGFGLADAKALVESAPTLVLRNANAEEAEAARKQLRQAGAIATVRPHA